MRTQNAYLENATNPFLAASGKCFREVNSHGVRWMFGDGSRLTVTITWWAPPGGQDVSPALSDGENL
jgi:hypothetical protein